MTKDLLNHALNWDNWAPDGDIEPGTPGVYALFDDGVPVYIGHSSNLPRRLAQHDHEGSKSYSSTKVYHRNPQLSSESFRLQLESLLILYYLPKYNKGLNLGFASPGKVWEIKWSRKRSDVSSGPRNRR